MWVFTIDIIHQFLVLRFVYNSNDLIALFHIVGADRLIDRSAAVQVIDDELFYLFRIFANDRTYLSQIQTLNSTVYYSAFQDHSKNTVKSGLGTVKVSGDQYDSCLLYTSDAADEGKQRSVRFPGR